MPAYIHVPMKFCFTNGAQENIVLARTAAKMQVYLEYKIRTAHLTHNPNYFGDLKKKQAGHGQFWKSKTFLLLHGTVLIRTNWLQSFIGPLG